ncbi:permease-like cell division protein FtsX, partial [Planococcus sp. SIMBA_143]
LLLNLNAFGDQLESDVEISAFIDLTAKQDQQDELKESIENISGVETVTYQSKEEGLDNLIENLGDNGEVFESLKDENPLSDAFLVKTTDPQDVNDVAKQIQQLDNVQDVEFAEDTVNRLFKVLEIARNVGLALVVGLL